MPIDNKERDLMEFKKFIMNNSFISLDEFKKTTYYIHFSKKLSQFDLISTFYEQIMRQNEKIAFCKIESLRNNLALLRMNAEGLRKLLMDKKRQKILELLNKNKCMRSRIEEIESINKLWINPIEISITEVLSIFFYKLF